MKRGLKQLEILQIEKNSSSVIPDYVIAEIHVDLFLNDTKFTTIACTGNDVKDMAVGFLRSQEIVMESGDLVQCEVSPDGNRVYVVTKEKRIPDFHESILSSGAKERIPGEGGRKIDSSITIPAKYVLKLMKNLLNSSSLHKATHGTHCSALADLKGIIAVREDIGRHNTIDMLGGYALLKRIDCSDKMILTTGRVSSEIVNKVWTLGVPVIVSRSAPTSRAINLSKDAGITIVGYVRNARMKVYSGEERVIF